MVRIPFYKPSLPHPDKWLKYLEPAYEQAHFTNSGPVVQELESRLCERYNFRDAMLVCNATLGLQLALSLAREVGYDQVLVPNFTFPATAASAFAAGFSKDQVVLCEVDAWGVLHSRPHPGALAVVVCPFGIWPTAQMLSRVLEMVGPTGAVVIDAAASLTKDPVPKYALAMANLVVFSLHATKTFGIGEGGLVVAGNRDSTPLRDCRAAANFGFLKDKSSRGLIHVTNAKMSDFQAAVGLAVLDDIDGKTDRRRRAAVRYASKLPVFQVASRLSNQVVPVQFANRSLRDSAQARLRGVGIGTRIYYELLGDHFDILASTPMAEMLSSTLLCVPMFEEITDAQVDEVTQCLLDSL